MKKGEMTIGNITGLIIAIAVVVVLFILLAKLFVPFFDRGDEIAESYFETLKDEIKVADNNGVGEFFMWYLVDTDKEAYLVYFGDTQNVKLVKYIGPHEKLLDEQALPEGYSLDRKRKFDFHSLGKNDNRICICVAERVDNVEYDISCRYCEDLDHPVEFSDNGDFWYDTGGKLIKIKKDGNRYVFTKAE